MNFDLNSLQRGAFRMALVGLVGCHALFVYRMVSEIKEFNAVIERINEPQSKSGMTDAQKAGAELTLMWSGINPHEEKEIDYVKLANPLLSINHFHEWDVFNHLLFWPGFVAFMLWLILSLGGKR